MLDGIYLIYVKAREPSSVVIYYNTAHTKTATKHAFLLRMS